MIALIGAQRLFHLPQQRIHLRLSLPEIVTLPAPWTTNRTATIQIGDAQIMMSDGGCMTQNDKFEGFGVSLTAADAATAERFFNALAQGGKVTMPYQKTFWSPGFGMLSDKFGVPWMVSAPHDQPPA